MASRREKQSCTRSPGLAISVLLIVFPMAANADRTLNAMQSCDDYVDEPAQNAVRSGRLTIDKKTTNYHDKWHKDAKTDRTFRLWRIDRNGNLKDTGPGSGSTILYWDLQIDFDEQFPDARACVVLYLFSVDENKRIENKYPDDGPAMAQWAYLATDEKSDLKVLFNEPTVPNVDKGPKLYRFRAFVPQIESDKPLELKKTVALEVVDSEL